MFRRDGVLYRQVNRSYGTAYDQLLSSGLYETLSSRGLLVAHREVDTVQPPEPDAYRVLRPDPVAFISYPYEWCFSALRAAALLTLEVQKQALAHDMILKDASAFNVQFRGTAPVLIDTLSFAPYEEGKPWVAYRQFCQHFLAPLLLMSGVDARLGRLQAAYLDGIPLDLASRLLPRRSWLRLSPLLHVHLHARAIRRYGGVKIQGSRFDRAVRRSSLLDLVESLEGTVRGLRWVPGGTEWAEYEDAHSYADESLSEKKRIVEACLRRTAPRMVWDLGANTGVFSRIASDLGAVVIAVDGDPAAVERAFLREREGAASLLPLVMDLAQPTPGLGWASRERMSLEERGPADVVMALALVHHLAITNNVPLGMLSGWFASLGRHLIVEWVPKSDPQTQRLLLSREDIFDSFSEAEFRAAFQEHFVVDAREPIQGTERVIYAMTRRVSAGAQNSDGNGWEGR